jgi:hypothetical protein
VDPLHPLPAVVILPEVTFAVSSGSVSTGQNDIIDLGRVLAPDSQPNDVAAPLYSQKPLVPAPVLQTTRNPSLPRLKRAFPISSTQDSLEDVPTQVSVDISTRVDAEFARCNADAAKFNLKNVGKGPMKADKFFLQCEKESAKFDVIRRQMISGRPAIAGEPSAEIRLNAALAKKRHDDRNKEIRLLDKVLDMLTGHCIVCWAMTGKFNKRGHRMFIDCSAKTGYIEYGFGWIDLKKEMKYPAFTHCYGCGLPQGREGPGAHTSLGKKCLFGDFVVLLLWHIRHDPDTAAAALAQFSSQGFNIIGTIQSFARWCLKGETPYNNGMLLVLWFIQRRTKVLNQLQ